MKTKLLLAAMMLSMSLSLFAQSGTCGTNLTWNLSNGVLTISGTGAMTNYTYDGSIYNTPWYSYRESIKTVKIGSSVTSIGEQAFADCSSLTSITIPNSVTSIGDGAFSSCSSLTSVTIPNSVTSIGENAFAECSSLTSITIPNSVTSIGENAFAVCSSLTSIEIPNSVTSIGDWAFALCSSLTSITIPSSVTSIGDGAFESCTSLTSITIPNSVTRIGEGVFYHCTGLTSVTIPNSVTSIGYAAFYNCSSLTSITIPNSVTWIGDNAFDGCSSLKNVILGTSVKVLEDSAFYRCSSIETITCYSMRPPTVNTDALYGLDYSTIVYVPADYLETYKMHNAWGLYDVRPLGAVKVETEEVTITPSDNTVDIVWPEITGATTYELIIRDTDGNIVCTLIFDAQGHLTQIAFSAPARTNVPEQTQAAGFSFTVTGLKENTEYTYTLTAKDSKGKAIDTKTGTFKTIGGTPVDETERDAAPAPRKLLKNGILYILTPDGTAYDLQGQRID
ncbi:MAG: leucine-rich repeat domain-containing protein [Paludibacteraceae bacterium]|nr:leucine-rich repeat domain-containing protein [Paludibacteraceae bacterium]